MLNEEKSFLEVSAGEHERKVKRLPSENGMLNGVLQGFVFRKKKKKIADHHHTA